MTTVASCQEAFTPARAALMVTLKAEALAAIAAAAAAGRRLCIYHALDSCCGSQLAALIAADGFDVTSMQGGAVLQISFPFPA